MNMFAIKFVFKPIQNAEFFIPDHSWVGPARIWDVEFGDDVKLAFLRRSIR